MNHGVCECVRVLAVSMIAAVARKSDLLRVSRILIQAPILTFSHRILAIRTHRLVLQNIKV